MDVYSNKYLKDHCVDVFFRYKSIPIHILTDGTLLPPSINKKSTNRKLQQIFSKHINECTKKNAVVYEKYKQKVTEEIKSYDLPFPNEQEYDYFSIYRDYANIGFYSFACKNDGNGDFSYGIFELVCFPKERTKLKDFENLPEYNELKNISYDEDDVKIIMFSL